MPKVTVIPATKDFYTGLDRNEYRRRRVAGYARVSTNDEEQQTSYAAQVDYYTKYIKSRPDWEFVKVYTDEGITATNTKKRDGFNEMVENALAGNIDLIVTKAVSRFARNTVDSLTTIRKLKDKGVEVYFEKENIYTFDSKGELILTIMSSLAQEESRSISENVTWGKRKYFADGKISMPYKHFLGYKKGEDDLPEIIPEEAEIVRMIYRLFMEGKSTVKIAQVLTEMGIETPAKTHKPWQVSTVESILTNEKYKGSAILQKKYTVNYLEKKMAVNNGRVPKYFIEDSHPAIIPPGEFALVQEEMKRRKGLAQRYSCATIFASKLICGECQSYFGPKVWHSNSKYRRVIYRCNKKYEGEHSCESTHITEEELKQAFVTAMNILIADKNALLEDCRLVQETLADMIELDLEIAKQTDEVEYAKEVLKNCIEDNTKEVQDQAAYWKKYDSLNERYEGERVKLSTLLAEKDERRHKAEIIGGFMFELHEQDGFIEEFDERLWGFMVDNVVVAKDKKLTFNFRNGTAITI